LRSLDWTLTYYSIISCYLDTVKNRSSKFEISNIDRIFYISMSMNHIIMMMAAAVVATALITGAINPAPIQVHAMNSKTLQLPGMTPTQQGSGGPNSNAGASQQQVLGLLGLGSNPNSNVGTGPGSNTGGPSQGPMSLMGSGAGPVSSGGGGNGPMGMVSGLLNNLPLASSIK
jgi:hypothetical protein